MNFNAKKISISLNIFDYGFIQICNIFINIYFPFHNNVNYKRMLSDNYNISM